MSGGNVDRWAASDATDPLDVFGRTELALDVLFDTYRNLKCVGHVRTEAAWNKRPPYRGRCSPRFLPLLT